MEHTAETIYKAAGFTKEEVSGLHILRRTFATNMHKKDVRDEEIAAYIRDTVETTVKYYIAARQKCNIDGETKNIVK